MKNVFKIFTAILMVVFINSKSIAQISVGISVGFAPPEMPVYVQPECPEDGYMWQPGYWAYDDNDGYYWVPGVWVEAPEPGYLWTPPYWGYVGGAYGFHRGYWGHDVGFYGGINYGGGYGGVGFGGGMWSGNHFRYNTAVVNVNRTVIHNTYVNRTVINNQHTHSRTSFNGGNGTTARPRPQEVKAMNERHLQPTAQQISHQQVASKERSQFSTVNHGRPTATAVNKVGGRPFNPQGKVVSGTAFGKGASPAKSNTAPSTFRPSQQQKPAQQQHQAQPQQHQAQPQQRPAQQQQQQRPQQQQQQRPQQQQQQRPQQQQQPRPQQQQQPRPQQQQQPRPQQQQQPRPQQQQQPRPQQQQQHNNPRPEHGH